MVSSTGFFWIARSILGGKTKLFGFQRVPFICRVEEYGSKARIKGYKSFLKIAGSGNNQLDKIASFFETSLQTPVITLNHYLEASLTNSNPLLHPARIYSILQKKKSGIFDKEILFYEEWDDFSSETLINCDSEFQKILTLLPVNPIEIPTILDYYESCDASSLTNKMRSIQAFQGIKLNMLKTGETFRLNLKDRYFTEDIPYGLLIIKSISTLSGQKTPTIDKVIEKIQQQMHKSYLETNRLSGKDLKETGIVQNYGISSIQQLSTL